MSAPPVLTVEEVPPSGLVLEVPLTEDWLRKALGDTDFGAQPLAGVAALEVHRQGRDVRIKGNLQLTLHAPCVRCLELLELPIDEGFSLRLVPAPAGPNARGRSRAEREEELELDPEDLDTDHYEGDKIDLAPWLREQILVAAPVWPRHDFDCPLPTTTSAHPNAGRA